MTRVARIRLSSGRALPVPPSESVDGVLVLTPETVIEVREGSWARRRISRGDVERVAEPWPKPPPAAAEPPMIDLDLDGITPQEDDEP